jgi:hypothetical protein
MCLIYGLISMTVLQLAQKVKAQIVPEFGGLGDNGIWHSAILNLTFMA